MVKKMHKQNEVFVEPNKSPAASNISSVIYDIAT